MSLAKWQDVQVAGITVNGQPSYAEVAVHIESQIVNQEIEIVMLLKNNQMAVAARVRRGDVMTEEVAGTQTPNTVQNKQHQETSESDEEVSDEEEKYTNTMVNDDTDESGVSTPGPTATGQRAPKERKAAQKSRAKISESCATEKEERRKQTNEKRRRSRESVRVIEKRNRATSETAEARLTGSMRPTAVGDPEMTGTPRKLSKVTAVVVLSAVTQAGCSSNVTEVIPR